MTFRLNVVGLFFCVLGWLLGAELASAQECSMNGKQMQWRIRICSNNRQLGCSRLNTRLVFVGDKVIEYDENPTLGIIFELNRTIDVTENDVPYVKQIVSQNGFANAKVSLSATLSNGTLGLSQSLYFLNNLRQVVAQMSLSYQFQIYGCAACKTLNYESRGRGQANEDITKMVQEISCEVTKVNAN